MYIHMYVVLSCTHTWEPPNVSSCMGACFAGFWGSWKRLGGREEGVCPAVRCCTTYGSNDYRYSTYGNYVYMQVIWILHYIHLCGTCTRTYICRVKLHVHSRGGKDVMM